MFLIFVTSELLTKQKEGLQGPLGGGPQIKIKNDCDSFRCRENRNNYLIGDIDTSWRKYNFEKYPHPFPCKDCAV